jgi:hypothetical protein
MDADVMPLCNLDYLFELSEQGILKENLIMAGKTEPASGGFFMLRPDAEDYQQLLSIVKRQHDYATKNSSYPFDHVLGWGHAIQSPDEWVGLPKDRKRDRIWNFHGYFADQGLLYHWVKYVKQSVSILLLSTLQNWSPPPLQTNDITSNASTATSPVMEWNTSTSNINGFGCPMRHRIFRWHFPSPYKDFVHFTGNMKPWERKNIPDDIQDPRSAEKPYSIWFHWLRKASEELQLNLNLSTILVAHRPSLGRYPTIRDMVDTARADVNSTGDWQ